MTSELIVNSQENRISIALLENGTLVEIHDRSLDHSCVVGDIFLGRVKKITAGLNAAFVDLGIGKDGFIHYCDLGNHFHSFKALTDQLRNHGQFSPEIFRKYIGLSKPLPKDGRIVDFLKAGDLILVQITKEAISTKGPRLTCEISVAGRNMVLLPFYQKISLSQRIENKEEKKRLKHLFTSILPKYYGVIVRTACEQKSVAQLNAELTELVPRFESCLKLLHKQQNPFLLLSEDSKIMTILRDLLTGDFQSIHVNDEEVFREVKQYVSTIAPEKANIVNHYNGKQEIFEHFNVSRQIKASFGRIVPLKKGAYVIIEHTEALHVVDVNSGIRLAKSNDNQEELSLEVNLQAAEEIARQLRLRDMGGIIVIDFIDLHSPTNRRKLLEKMMECMLRDKAKHNILPLSKLGLLQLTRQRVKPATVITTTENCPSCSGTGKISAAILIEDNIEDALAYLTGEGKHKSFQLSLHPFLAAYYRQGWLSSKRRELATKYKCKLKIIVDNNLSLLEYKFHDSTGQLL